MSAPAARFDDRLIATIADGVRRNVQVRRRLPGDGRVHIDRQLPFLAVYRPPTGRPDPGTRFLVEGEAAYVIAPRLRRSRGATQRLVVAIAEALTHVFGAFLVIEIWSVPPPPRDPYDPPARPAFRVVTARADADAPSVIRLQQSLSRIRVQRLAATVAVQPGGRLAPRGFAPVIAAADRRRLHCHLVGLEVSGTYQDPAGKGEYPLLRRSLQRQVGNAVKRAFYEFAHHETDHRPAHYQALGRRAVVKAVWAADAALAEISATFDLLLLVTPTNTEAAWRAFRRNRYESTPAFRYRPVPLDPVLLKRRLYAIPIERVEDPTLLRLFEDKRRELELKLTLLSDRGTRRFLPTSLATYGSVDRDLAELAADLLDTLPARRDRSDDVLDADAFARQAEAELSGYRSQDDGLRAAIQVRDDVASVMVSDGRVLVGRGQRFSAGRVEALLNHEVGTHLVTWHNGRAQRFQLMGSGLPGYDELQEGLGVFAEWAVGGLDPVRLRLLAARVIAVRMLVDGAEFVEAHRALRALRLSARSAYHVVMRVWRGGGFVKDAVYLRGLQTVLDYLAEGGGIESLFVGKIAVGHVGIVEELLRRRILIAPRLLPRYLVEPAARRRVDAARSGITVRELL